ncbi:MAG: hypothetical protein FH748_10730, partial [Balneolaceae bacterium]|nr:hypothetical protein [Balneolaceae bacterium]
MGCIAHLFYMKTIYTHVIIILLLLGCSKGKEVQPSSGLESYILDLPEVEVSKTKIDIDREQVSSILGTIENSIPDKVFLIDHNVWSIFMAKKDGTLLDQKGRQGRGPGEYMGINDMYTYIDESVLQVFDKKLKRLTYYDITEDSLKLSSIVHLPDYGQYYLQSVFKSNDNTVGIFRVLRQYENMEVENKLYVHYLDEEFRMKEKILEIEGSELIETTGIDGSKRFRENIFGNETVWSFNNGKLFYSNAENLNFKVFNFNTKNISEHKISDIPEYINTSETIDFMMKRYSSIFNYNPEYEAYFKQRKTLPYFSHIYASDKFLYIPLTNYGNEKGHVLRFNIETRQMERIEIPPNFYM